MLLFFCIDSKIKKIDFYDLLTYYHIEIIYRMYMTKKMLTKQVYNISELIKADNDSHTLITLCNKKVYEPKKESNSSAPAKKKQMGSMFYLAMFDMSHIGKIKEKTEGVTFCVYNLKLAGGIQSKQDNDKRDKPLFENNRLQLNIKCVDNPDFSKFMDIIEREWVKAVNTATTGDAKTRLFNKTNKQTHMFVQRTYKDENEEDVNMESPMIRLKVRFDKYPDNHPNRALRGMPKCTLRDYKSGRITNGHNVFDVAKVDGEIINPDNIHNFITKNSIVHKMKFSFGTVCVTSQWIILELNVDDAIIESADVENELEPVYDDDVTISPSSNDNELSLPPPSE